MNNLFVYGTLKSNGSRATVFEDSTLLGEAVLIGRNWHMYDLGAFPAVVLEQDQAENSVQGELYEIDDEVLAMCDAIEGHPDFYVRREAMAIVYEEDGDFRNTMDVPIKCLVYTIPVEDIKKYGASEITKGIWE